MIEQVLEKIFEKVDALPTFPKAAQRALSLLKEDEIDFKEIEKVIKSDPGITANFLKIVNSAAFALPQKADSLFKAFMFLGVNQIKFILMASIAKQYYKSELTGYGISSQDIWYHSILCGIIAEEIAKNMNFGYKEIESIYIASILHDIGKIVLDLYTKLEVEEFYKLMEEDPERDFIQIEWLVLGVDHGLVGGYLLEKWDFPKSIAFAVRAHHDPDLMLRSKISAVVALSNALANILGIGGSLDAFNYFIPEKLLEIINLDKEKIWEISKIAFEKSVLIKKEF
jgi:HD-like signal output (HDOD) protein